MIRLLSLIIVLTLSSLSAYAQYTWDSQVSNTSSSVQDIYFAPTGNNKGIYCTTNGHIGRTNNGTDWVVTAVIPEINSDFTSDWMKGVYIQDNPGNIAVAVSNGGYFYRSTDAGSNWDLVHYNGSGTYLQNLEYSNGRLFTASTFYMYYSDDVGLTWDSLAIPSAGSVLDISFNGNNGVYCTSGTVWYSTDLGMNWTECIGLPHNYDMNGVEMVNSTTFFTVGDFGEIQYTDDLGANWFNSVSGTNEALYKIEYGNDQYGIITGANGTVLTTNNGGYSSWDVSSHTATTTSAISGLHAQNQVYAWFGNSTGEIFKSPAQDVDIDIVDFISPDTVCFGETYSYQLKFVVTLGIAVDPAFQVLLNSNNISGGYVTKSGVYNPSDTFTVDFTYTMGISTEGSYSYIANVIPNATETSTLLDWWGFTPDFTEVYVVTPLPTTTNSPVYFCDGETISLSASGGDDYFWLSSDVDDPYSATTFVTPTSETNYLVTIEQPHCTVIDTVFTFYKATCDSIVVPVDTILAPASAYAFSPNGDNVNDTFVLDYLVDFPTNHVSIFNRWGDLVAEFPNYDNETIVWDGTFNGILVGAGTYYFIVEYNGTATNGWVQVVE